MDEATGQVLGSDGLDHDAGRGSVHDERNHAAHRTARPDRRGDGDAVDAATFDHCMQRSRQAPPVAVPHRRRPERSGDRVLVATGRRQRSECRGTGGAPPGHRAEQLGPLQVGAQLSNHRSEQCRGGEQRPRHDGGAASIVDQVGLDGAVAHTTGTPRDTQSRPVELDHPGPQPFGPDPVLDQVAQRLGRPLARQDIAHRAGERHLVLIELEVHGGPSALLGHGPQHRILHERRHMPAPRGVDLASTEGSATAGVGALL